jgi:hypothetical protein
MHTRKNTKHTCMQTSALPQQARHYACQSLPKPAGTIIPVDTNKLSCTLMHMQATWGRAYAFVHPLHCGHYQSLQEPKHQQHSCMGVLAWFVLISVTARPSLVLYKKPSFLGDPGSAASGTCGAGTQVQTGSASMLVYASVLTLV